MVRSSSVCFKTRCYTTSNPRFVEAASFALHLSDESQVGTICMLHHAARVSKRTLSTFTSTPEHANAWPGSPFATALQVAAARAWTRTAVRNLRTVSMSAPVTLEEEDTTQTRKPLPGVPSDSDSGNWLRGRRISAFVCVNYCTVFGDRLTRI